ncbi:carbohydrate-binding protein [Streptomyces netropsis]|uniref:carbohydrate-binding protein n=1 Tax=Streptomyces netropsis TaxID=55404 RepID=UPI00379CAB7A
MTAGNNGQGTPEGDDPFGYLYRSEGGDGGTDGGQQAHQPGVPRTSYNQVRPVGSRQYGQQPQQQVTYGQQAPGTGPAPHYAAPETLPGGAPQHSAQGGHQGGRAAGRSKRRGPLIAAIAVVAVVVCGIGVAIFANGSDEKKEQQNTANGGGEDKQTPAGGDKPDETKKSEPEKRKPAKLPKEDAASLRLSGGAVTEKTVPGAQGDGGLYIAGMNKQGAGVEWKVDVEKEGDYRLNARYGVPGTDAALTIFANGKADTRAINMKNFGGTKDWENGWKTTWSLVKLNKGTNIIRLSCEAGNSCDVHLDQLWISPKNG